MTEQSPDTRRGGGEGAPPPRDYPRSESGGGASVRTTRLRRRWFEFPGTISPTTAVLLGAAIYVLFFGAWYLAAEYLAASQQIFPPPQQVIQALYVLFTEEQFLNDVGISIYRIVASFAAACLVAIPLGILMGTFRVVEGFFNPLASPARYLPAPAFIPLLLMWLGTGDLQKMAILFLGVVWFLTALIMDHTQSIPREYIETSRTLGANRRQVLRTVIIPAVMPNVVISMRQMLAVSWTYLIIAEVVAATDGIGAMMMRAKRFIHSDRILAGIVTIGILGFLFDYAFRKAYRWLFPYQE